MEYLSYHLLTDLDLDSLLRLSMGLYHRVSTFMPHIMDGMGNGNGPLTAYE